MWEMELVTWGTRTRTILIYFTKGKPIDTLKDKRK